MGGFDASVPAHEQFLDSVMAVQHNVVVVAADRLIESNDSHSDYSTPPRVIVSVISLTVIPHTECRRISEEINVCTA